MNKRTRQSDLSHFCHKGQKTCKRKVAHPQPEKYDDRLGEYLAKAFNGEITRLTTEAATSDDDSSSSFSWVIHVKHWFPTPSSQQFESEWNLHPLNRKMIRIFNKQVQEARWSQAWGRSINYSGLINEGRNIKESSIIPPLLKRINDVMAHSPLENNNALYNACLQNWYEVKDTMGLHSDDEKYLRAECPIFSLSWGGSRRFLLRSKTSPEKVELWLDDGDLLIMGGTTQQTHKHEIPKHRTKDPATSRRINWTFRAIKEI
jgi:Alkylated DNA repair protein